VVALPAQHASSDRTPLARILPRVIGGPACDRGRVLMPGEDIALAGRAEILTGRFRVG
jgi:hypothetical protein